MPKPNEVKRLLVLELWRDGKSTFEISREVKIPEIEVCRIIDEDEKASKGGSDD